MFKKIRNKLREKSRISARRSLGRRCSFWRLFLIFYVILFVLEMPLNLIEMTASLKEEKGNLQSAIETKKAAMYFFYGQYVLSMASYAGAHEKGWAPHDIQDYQFLNPSYLSTFFSNDSACWWCLYDINESRMIYDEHTGGTYAQVRFSEYNADPEYGSEFPCMYWLDGAFSIPAEAVLISAKPDRDILYVSYALPCDGSSDSIIWIYDDFGDEYRYTAIPAGEPVNIEELRFCDDYANGLDILEKEWCYGQSTDWQYTNAALEDFQKWKDNFTNRPGEIEHIETKESLFHKTYCNRLVLEDASGNPEYLFYSSFAFPEIENKIIKIWRDAILAILLQPVLLSLVLAFFISRRSKQNHAIYQYRTTLNNAMAHDLKTPLMAISGYAENISMETNPDKRDYYVEEIRKQTDYMKSMVDGIRKLAESGDSDGGMREPVQLEKLIEEVVGELQNSLASRKLTVRISGNCSIKANIESMKTVFRNLLDNACKYASEDSEISIVMGRKELTVSNDIDREIQTAPEKLLEPFTKGDTSRNGRKGTGLGLAVVKSICDMYGFRISLKTQEKHFCVCMKF